MPQLDFVESCGMDESVFDAVPWLAGILDAVQVGPGLETHLMMPNLTQYGNGGIVERPVPHATAGNSYQLGKLAL